MNRRRISPLRCLHLLRMLTSVYLGLRSAFLVDSFTTSPLTIPPSSTTSLLDQAYREKGFLLQTKTSSPSTSLHASFTLGIDEQERQPKSIYRPKNVFSTQPIGPGDTLPHFRSRVLRYVRGSKSSHFRAYVDELLGDGTCLLVGMPSGSTCREEHLPGIIAAAPLLKKLGVDRIAIVTTDSEFIEHDWELCLDAVTDSIPNVGSQIYMIGDRSGKLVKSLGLYQTSPKHKRILSKRFALLLQNGESSYLSIDEGADTCEFTSADAIVDLLSPMSSGAEREEEKRQIEEANQSGILAAAGAMFLAVVMAVTMPSTVDVSSAAGLQ